ncbi:MAG: hypothetical protein FWG64_02105 [Firmicutes bacterium]|nr:hypothetical protein [Bacillota bacterium]
MTATIRIKGIYTPGDEIYPPAGRAGNFKDGEPNWQDNHILAKFGKFYKGYHFNEDFLQKYPTFTQHFLDYRLEDRYQKSMFKHEYDIIDYIERNKIPPACRTGRCKIFNDFSSKEFANFQAVREYVQREEWFRVADKQMRGETK